MAFAAAWREGGGRAGTADFRAPPRTLRMIGRMQGLHLTADLHGCLPGGRAHAAMTDRTALRELCLAAVQRSGLAPVGELFHRFDACEAEAQKLVALGLPLPAYEQVCKASHSFNLLDARRAISVTERQRYILRVRTLARAVAEAYFAQREKLGFPGLKTKKDAA